MAVRVMAKKELLVCWRRLVEFEDQAADDSSKIKRFRKTKEEWFSDAFNYLIQLSVENHIWCGNRELMGPLLETFHDYSKDENDNSPLKDLYQRISLELRRCAQCITQHHEAQEMYRKDFDLDTVQPLLNILQTLDEERVTEHLKEINSKVTRREYDPEKDHAEVACVLFEVLMFPTLLDDHSLVNEFQPFIEAMDSSHKLTLAVNQKYPGVYALLFLKSEKVRAIGHHLAGCMGKLRKAEDLEPLQPLLKKCIGFLETEVLTSTLDTSRPRVQFERLTVWLGIKVLLGFLEPLAFEEGILERHPTFLSIVLNHVSDDTLEFTHAVTCLKFLFETLGCKLWLRTPFSPSVMRNTLLGQCFHTRSEKSHNQIFDLFQPFLQSLESLQDGEHERQRRHFIYFLLHQVTQGSNFSFLMRKKARKIAFQIIDRGYKMNPPCPPSECSHVWGPSLVCSLKDSSLHKSLREPAFDLIRTIIITDAAALISLKLKCHTCPSPVNSMSFDLNDDEDDLPFDHDVEETENSCWAEFSSLGKVASRECNEWICIPLLWLEVLVETDPSALPMSFSKAVFWALSRFSVVEPEDSVDSTLSVRDWIFSHAKHISASFNWDIPKGCDDGGAGKESKNSVNSSTSCIILIRMLKRCAAHFVTKLEQGELLKQWAWEPRMAECLILLLVDTNDNVRQVDRFILEHLSNSRCLASGLHFLCSTVVSLSAIFVGLRYAMKLVQAESLLSNFHYLHHLFFVVGKLLKDSVTRGSNATAYSANDSSSKFQFDGGFLWQPKIYDIATTSEDSANVVEKKNWNKFYCLVSAIVWPALLKCLTEGKAFIDCKNTQMTCVRILEILPVVCERIRTSEFPLYAGSEVTVRSFFDFKWLHDLIDWGKSSLIVINKHWKQSLISLLNLFKTSGCNNFGLLINTIESLPSLGSKVDELQEQVSRLAVSLSQEAENAVGRKTLKENSFVLGRWPSLKRNQVAHIAAVDLAPEKTSEKEVIVLSDDEMEESILFKMQGKKHVGYNALDTKRDHHSSRERQRASQTTAAPRDAFASPCSSKDLDSEKVDSLKPRDLASLPECTMNQPDSLFTSSINECLSSFSSNSDVRQKNSMKNSENSPGSDSLIKEIVCAIEEPKEHALNFVGHPLLLSRKPSALVPKRQVIQLEMLSNHKSHRSDGTVQRFRPPRLDDWYKPILELDYFSLVRLGAGNEDEIPNLTDLKEVPVCFQSPEHYVEVFRPFVLEEFKAQLLSSYADTSSLDDMCSGTVRLVSVERIDDFHLIRCIPGDRESAVFRGCYENDLVLLTRQPFQNAPQNVHMVGKVERRERDNKTRSSVLVIRFYLQNGCSRLNKVKRLLIERSKWHVTRIMSITPQLREFQALSSLKDIPILPIILSPSDCAQVCNEPRKIDLGKLSQSLQQKLKSSFNESQLQAVTAALETSDSNDVTKLSLIQGPPGTGKTKTVVAIVSAMLSLGDALRSHASSDKTGGSSEPTSSTYSRPRAQQSSQDAQAARAWHDAALARQLVKDEEKGNSSPSERYKRGRVLICAQSNAAVDELVSRITDEGLYNSDGNLYMPYLVRVGNVKTVHPSSMPYFINTLVEQRLAEQKMNVDDGDDDIIMDSSMVLRSKLEKLVETIQLCEAKRADIREGNNKLEVKRASENGVTEDSEVQEMTEAAIDVRLKSLYGQKKAIYVELAASQAREKKSFEDNKAIKHDMRKLILKEAEVVVTTLSGCGGDLYITCTESISRSRYGSPSEDSLFDAVLIDEAAQALEPATLIPLQLLKTSRTKCIMVGDPKQLPATVLSNVASKFLYECSMFERLQRAGFPVTMLKTQYRMHPEISMFPSMHFYDRKLLNGSQMISKSASFHENSYLGPYIFFDVIDGQEHCGKSSNALSLCNESEADAAIELLWFFKKRYPSEFVRGRIGIITPYKSQVSLLRSRFVSAFGPSALDDVEFNTVDGFQGREVDVLILSTVRASEQNNKEVSMSSSSIGFVADVRRMNVALTRAKRSLWVFGNRRTLKTNLHWEALIRNAEERSLIVAIERPYDSFFRKRKDDRHANIQGVKSRKESNDLTRNEQDRVTKSVSAQFSSNSIETDGKCVSSAVHGHDVRLRDSPHERDHREHRPRKDVKTSVPATYGRHHEHRGKTVTVNERREIRENHDDMSSTGDTQKGEGRFDRSQSEMPRVNAHSKSEKIKVDGEASSSNEVKGGASALEDILIVDSSQQDSSTTNGKGEEGVQGQASNIDAAKDSIITRKRQREAVDALLSSSLISNKKPETSKLASITRPPSSAMDGRNTIKPSKPSKGPLKIRQLQGTTEMPLPKAHHPEHGVKGSSSGINLDREWKSFNDLRQD
ncbi:hypothetical protein AMTRI_Chr01g114000 [Amborella trichopoda]